MAENTEKKQSDIVAYWVSEISAAKKREKDWRKDGDRILKIYDGREVDTTPFNILFSNTETLLPALYSAIPRPVVDRRFKDEDPLGKAAAQAGVRDARVPASTPTSMATRPSTRGCARRPWTRSCPAAASPASSTTPRSAN
jgi:hypothetical protein